MEQDPLEKLIQERYPILPDDIKAYMASPRFPAEVKQIADSDGFNEDQRQSLFTEIMLVFLMAEDIIDFVRNCKESAGIDIGQANKVAMAVNEKIFKQFDESFQHIAEFRTLMEENPEAIVEFAAAARSSSKPAAGAPNAALPNPTALRTNRYTETRTDHILPQESEEMLLPDGNAPKTPSMSAAAKPQTASGLLEPEAPKPPAFANASFVPKTRPTSGIKTSGSVPYIETLESDIKNIKNRGIVDQKLAKIVTSPKEQRKFEVPDPKNRSLDPYREPLN